jgi:multiple sugar transport system permease protein
MGTGQVPVGRGMNPLARMAAELRHTFKSRMARSEAAYGFAFALPWILGFLIFTLWPIYFSVVLSFSEWDPYDPVTHRTFVGVRNFVHAFTADPLVWKSLYNTFFYAIFAVPLGLATSLGLALLLNQKLKGIPLFRTLFYIPSVVGGVATSILWMYIFNPVFGPLNGAIHKLNMFFDSTGFLAAIDLPEPMWISDPAWMKPALILMHLWASGGAGMLIFLAGLQGVPEQLYEVAELDGAGRFRKFWNVTVPMITPTIFFNLVMGIIGALQVFMQAYILTNGTGGTDNSLLFYVLYLYQKAFIEYDMGYAAALAWILFVIILALTLLVIKSSAAWVYYEGEKGA